MELTSGRAAQEARALEARTAGAGATTSAMLEKEKADKVRQQNLRVALRCTCDAGYTHDAGYARYTVEPDPPFGRPSCPSRVDICGGDQLRPPRQYPEAKWYISPFCPYRTHAPADQPQVIIGDAVYWITFTIPGLRKEDLKISVEGGALYFVGQTTTDDFDVGISRAVRLPADADLASAINATTHADGIIETRVPRVNLQAQPKQPSEPIHPTEPPSSAPSAAAEPMQDWGAVAAALNAASTAAPSGDGSTAAFPPVFSFAPGTQDPSPPGFPRRQRGGARNSAKNVHGVNSGATFLVPMNPFQTTGSFAPPSSANDIVWSKGDVGWSTWDVPRLRPLRDFTQETLQQHVVSKVEQAGGYKIFIPSPGGQKTHTYRIEAYKSITYKQVQVVDPELRELRGNSKYVDMTPTGFLFVDSGPAIELYGADYTSPNVRITHQDGFVIVFIPLKEGGTTLPRGGPDLVS